MPRTKVSARKTVGKKEVDPNAPKKAISSFFMYAAEQRVIIKEKNKKITFGDMGKLIGKQWGELDDSEKAPYTEKAAEMKAAYIVELADYIENNPESITAKQAKEPKVKAAKKKSPTKKAKKAKSDDEDEKDDEEEEVDEDSE